MSKIKNTFRVVVATYIGDGVVFDVNGNFADPPRHLDFWWTRSIR